MLTAEQTLAELTKKICEVVPEACSPNKCKHGHKKGKMIRLRQEGVSIGEIGRRLRVPKGTVAWHLNNRRPILLDDVLRATKTGEMDKLRGRPSEKRIGLAVESFGELMQLERRGHSSVWESSGYRWTLGKPLSEQSPETISFLHSLLTHG